MSGDGWVRVPEPGDDEAEDTEGAGEGLDPGPPTPPHDAEWVAVAAPPGPHFDPVDTWVPDVEVSVPCWNCREPVAPRDPGCAACGRTRTHVLLICSDPCLELSHGTDTPLALGRHPDWAPRTATAFADRPKVSRRHVSITVEPDGSAWAEEPPEGSHNGTFINGAKLMPGIRTPLRDGDQLRLGLRISITVRLYGPG
ncbi:MULTISPECIES: FHA domain-containing protein [Streptomyces]|uniref:FHA domain-containing protein n=1 Tax=Streptomyces lonegramiae TaxID=3075524 RepID=A0ABU2XKR7_9ACTN|nr:FHA domain-containing protein [Streptomyces sp. DSM 41529]MDT0546515.1 FHA domain-containing protein [Streptomyces sp. DSM 41529]